MGVNLLPFIDRERLKLAIVKADDKEEKLTVKERERNRVTGEIFLFFKKSKTENDSKLEKLLTEPLPAETKDKEVQISTLAEFSNADRISGKVEVLKKVTDFVFGKPSKKMCGELKLDEQSLQTFKVSYFHPEYKQIESKILEGAITP